MARTFLSYAREDAAKAKSLANALEHAGHQVWWDRHVGGGAQFAAEIAKALRDAEVVVVVWSQTSVVSTWVHDEAAEGRDGGRLVPVSIDDSQPPLGFRQFQAIDLSGWRGRRNSAAFNALERAIVAVLKGERLPQAPPPARNAGWRGWPARIAAVLAMVLVAGVFFYLTNRSTASAATPALAVLPFADLSAAQDKAYFAEGMAEEIRSLLSTDPRLRVTGRSSTEKLGEKPDFQDVHKKLGASHLLEGSVRVEGQRLRMNVRLVNAKTGNQLWDERFDRKMDDVFAVQDEISTAVASRLRGSFRLAAQARQQARRTSPEVLDLYLAASAKWGSYAAHREAERLLLRAVELDPKYAPAWLGLSQRVYDMDAINPVGPWGPDWPKERARAIRYAQHALKLDDKFADAHAWLGFLEGEKEFAEHSLARAKRAIELDPNNFGGWSEAAKAYHFLCEPKKSLEALRRAAAIEPLEPGPQLTLSIQLQKLGQHSEAQALRREYEPLDPNPRGKHRNAERDAMWRGDLSQAIIHGLRVRDAGPPNPQRDLHVAYNLRAIGMTAEALKLLPPHYHNIVGAYWRGDYHTAAAQLHWLKSQVWSQTRSFAITRAAVRSGQHRQLLALFDQRFGSVEVFDRRLRCDLPMHAPQIVIALRQAGRTKEGNRLLDLALARHAQALKVWQHPPEQYVGHAELLALAGKKQAAISSLEQNLRRGGAGDSDPPYPILELGEPAFDSLRNEPGFKAVERKLEAWRAKERRELAAAGVRI